MTNLLKTEEIVVGIDLFLKGLAKETTKTQTWASLPCFLTAAAQQAQNIEARAHIFGTLQSGSSSSINTMQNQKQTCLACNWTRHILRDCRMWKVFKAKMTPQGKGRGKSSRGRGKVRGKTNQVGMRAVKTWCGYPV